MPSHICHLHLSPCLYIHLAAQLRKVHYIGKLINIQHLLFQLGIAPCWKLTFDWNLRVFSSFTYSQVLAGVAICISLLISYPISVQYVYQNLNKKDNGKFVDKGISHFWKLVLNQIKKFQKSSDRLIIHPLNGLYPNWTSTLFS